MKRSTRCILFTLIFCGIIPISCEECGTCGCGGTGGGIQYYQVDDLSAEAAVFRGGDLDTSRFYPYDSLALVLRVEQSSFVQSTLPKRRGFSFSTAAYACSPPEPESIQGIAEITLTTNSSFQTFAGHFEEGDIINDAFVLLGRGLSRANIDQNLSRIRLPMSGRTAVEFLLDFPMYSRDSLFNFNLKVVLTDQKVFEKDSIQFKIKS